MFFVIKRKSFGVKKGGFPHLDTHTSFLYVVFQKKQREDSADMISSATNLYLPVAQSVVVPLMPCRLVFSIKHLSVSQLMLEQKNGLHQNIFVPCRVLRKN